MRCSFIARTRLRGKIDYYKAEWINHGSYYQIRFEEGPNAGKSFSDRECVIALDEAYKKENEQRKSY